MPRLDIRDLTLAVIGVFGAVAKVAHWSRCIGVLETSRSPTQTCGTDLVSTSDRLAIALPNITSTLASLTRPNQS